MTRTLRNPILPGSHPDPSICRRGDTFYLVTSTFEHLPGLPIHASTDLQNWSALGHAIHRPEQLDLAGLDGSSGLYAPTIRVVGDQLVVVCTVVGPDDGSWPGRTGHFLVTATDASGPWSDPIWIDDVGGFDPSLTVDGDDVWLCGTRVVADADWPGQTEVWLSRIDISTGALLGELLVIWRGADARAVWAEGPHIVPRPGGGWVLVCAEGGTDLEHAVCVAYADAMAGPWLGDPGNPRLSHRDLGPDAAITAVGHADLVDDALGRTWATVLALHPVDGRRGLLGRRTSLVAVEWHDRRPVFAPGTGRVATELVIPHDVTSRSATASPATTDGLDAAPRGRGAADADWVGVGRFPAAFAEWSAGSRVQLTAGDDPSTRGTISALLTRLPAERAAVQATVELAGRRADLRGGLLLRVSESNHLELSVDVDGTVIVRIVTDGVVRELTRSATVAGAPVSLGVRVVDLVVTCVADDREISRVDVARIAPGPPRGFIGAFVGPVVVGEGSAVFSDLSVTV
ncbi:glycoside hydrolase family 43 protein [Schumannella sp. 10F1B-5-1]|uniref:glycoside hydrolase family 43 protein n=1 Tax=Schumannella sp. 10F1B-5-1 TaxID=2590780 RepID=UPI001131F616|nr:glycoside hydrolase family 43 protein [Schumannella sp. 10F1B-5-1]TPW72884.1 glycoside hydrolase family 43 protein [Schumannella sp. 10F1B-5-1]